MQDKSSRQLGLWRNKPLRNPWNYKKEPISSEARNWGLSQVYLDFLGRRLTELKAQHKSFSSVQSLNRIHTLCDPVNRSTPGLPVHHQLLEVTQTHVQWVCDAIQASHPLSSPSPALSLSQHQGLFQWVSSLHQGAKEIKPVNPKGNQHWIVIGGTDEAATWCKKLIHWICITITFL